MDTRWRKCGLDATGRVRDLIVSAPAGRYQIRTPPGEIMHLDAIQVLAEARDELRAAQ